MTFSLQEFSERIFRLRPEDTLPTSGFDVMLIRTS